MKRDYHYMGVAISLKDNNRRLEFLKLLPSLKYLKFAPMKKKDENGHWMPNLYEFWCEVLIGDMDNYDFLMDCQTLFNNNFTLVMTGID